MNQLRYKLRCPVMDRCPDTQELNEGRKNEDLANQYHELCTTCGYSECSTYQKLSRGDESWRR
jgi:hypothetical protein